MSEFAFQWILCAIRDPWSSGTPSPLAPFPPKARVGRSTRSTLGGQKVVSVRSPPKWDPSPNEGAHSDFVQRQPGGGLQRV